MKHAYLIMAHNEIELLKLLLKKLDNSNNLIFLHCDTKFNCDIESLYSVVKFSKIHLIKRMNVKWGKYSQIQCELELLKEAVKEECDYYHLITGVCLPIKSNDEINSFFEKNKGSEFISYDKTANETRNFVNCFDRWHFRLNSSKQNLLLHRFIQLCNIPLHILEKIANLLTGPRSKKFSHLKFLKGSAYFDITHSLASYIVNKEPEIKRIFKFTRCCDEVFLHTFAYNSPFADNITFRGTRYIDWHKHGSSPEILTLDHYEKLVESDYLFARKFSSSKSKELIKKLYNVEIS